MAMTVADLEDGTIRIAGGVAGYELAIKTITFDSNYPTGGETITAASLGLGTVVWLHAEPGGGYLFEYNYTTNKLLAYWGNNDAADGPLVQVADTTDLALISTRIIAIGTPA